MKHFKRIASLMLFLTVLTAVKIKAQNNPFKAANFGSESDAYANFAQLGSFTASGSDDWFRSNTFPGSGIQVIDTTGANALLNQLLSNPLGRNIAFEKRMAFPKLTTINGILNVDAIYMRDFHKNDQTSLLTGSKNGDNPATWLGGTSPVNNSTDIIDVYAAARRSGGTLFDSLWMFGGITHASNNGSRYFDFEIYRSDLKYNPATGQFSGFGEQAGHTAWVFDASGNIISSGDFLVAAEFNTSGLQSMEIRIWVASSELSKTPPNFSFTGVFDGAGTGATYGYASIKPKINGINYFFGSSNTAPALATPWQTVDQSGNMLLNYASNQFMEFGINLTALGIDPLNGSGDGLCNMEKMKLLVKSRSSSSFTSALKDFHGPVEFELNPVLYADANADKASLCPDSTTTVRAVTNYPPGTVSYSWTAQDGGNIIGSTTADTIVVDRPGTYIVSASRSASCANDTKDTVVIAQSGGCPSASTLPLTLTKFNAYTAGSNVQLQWSSENEHNVSHFEMERSADGKVFTKIFSVQAAGNSLPRKNYSGIDNVSSLSSGLIYYRLKCLDMDGKYTYSEVRIIRIGKQSEAADLLVYPNPAINEIKITIPSHWQNNEVRYGIYNSNGQLIISKRNSAAGQTEVINISALGKGFYFLQANTNKEMLKLKIIKN